jgi:hypothetical protein
MLTLGACAISLDRLVIYRNWTLFIVTSVFSIVSRFHWLGQTHELTMSSVHNFYSASHEVSTHTVKNLVSKLIYLKLNTSGASTITIYAVMM